MTRQNTRRLHLKPSIWLSIIMTLSLTGCPGCPGYPGYGNQPQRDEPSTPDPSICLTVMDGDDVGSGINFRENFKDHSADLAFFKDACVSAQATAGPELFYKALVPPNHKLEVRLLTSDDTQASAYIFTDCNDAAGTCLAGVEDAPSGQRSQLLHINTTMNEQTLIVAIDTPGDRGSLDGSIKITAIECFPGDQRCGEDGKTVERCTQEATYDRYACEDACFDGQCIKKSGDSCFDAFTLRGTSDYIIGDWTSGDDNFSPGSGLTGQCYINERATPKGREDFYSIELNAGEILEATMTTSSKTASLFILEDCADPMTCVSNNPTGGPTTLKYQTKLARTIYLIADNSSTSETALYTLNWNVRPGGACVPDQSRCLDAMTAALCAPNATTELTLSCDQGCAFGACKLTATTQDSCVAVATSAQDIGQGISVVADVEDFVDDLSEPLGCADGYRPLGKDFFYKVQLDPGDLVEVKAQGTGHNEPFIYAFTDCENASATCVASALEIDDSDATSLRYQNQTGASQTLIIAIDANKGSATGLLQAQISKLQPQCEPGSLRCDTNNVTLLNCNAQRRYVRYECEGSCTDGRCESPKGDVCFDAIELMGPTGELHGDWKEGTNTFSPRQGYTGLCYTHTDAFSVEGREDFYRVDLERGDLLSVSLLANYLGNTLFILESCVDPQACAQSTRIDTPTKLTYYADQARTVYIVATQRSELSSEEYVLHWSINKGSSCAPNQSRCIDAMTAGKCNDDGSVEEQVPCANGCDITGCTPDIATQDSCAAVAASMVSITSSVSTYAHIQDFTHELSVGGTVNCPISRKTDGEDFFYKIELAADARLKVRADSDGNVRPALYVFTDCADAQESCVAGQGSSYQKTAFIDHVNDTGTTQTVLLGVASMSLHQSGPVQVEIDIITAPCNFNTLQCSANGTSLQHCNSRGYFDTILCDGGCSNRACPTPKGDHCFDAVPLNPGGTAASTQYTDTVRHLWSLTPTFSLGTESCLKLETTAGADKFYSVILAAGQRLEATMTPVGFSAALYVLTQCDDPLSCVAPPRTQNPTGFGQPASVTYTNTTGSTQTVLLVADSIGRITGGGYSLTVDIQAPQ